MSPRVSIHSSASPACHPGYQYTALSALYVTKYTRTHGFQPCMSLCILVNSPTNLVCHSRLSVHSSASAVCHPGYQYTALQALYVTKFTSTHGFQPCMSPRMLVNSSTSPVCHSRVSIHRSASPVCHPGYQYTALPALHVTKYTSTHVYTGLVELFTDTCTLGDMQSCVLIP